MQPARVNGHAYVNHGADGSVKVCLHQMCSRVLEGRFHTASNGVGFMLTQTDFAVVRTKSLPHFCLTSLTIVSAVRGTAPATCCRTSPRRASSRI